MSRIVLVGFGEYAEDAIVYASEAMVDLGIKYPIISFEIRNSEIVPICTNNMQVDTEAASTAMDLPSMKQYLAQWERIIKELSFRFTNCLVSIPVEGVTQVALNGEILS
jgi:hypothetical protein